jgi:hypothetical protein
MARVSNEEIQKLLNEVLDKLPNGELEALKVKIEDLCVDIGDLKEQQTKLHKNLYNPEDGLVVRVNRNREYRVKLQEEGALDTIRTVDKFRANYNKLLWGLYALLLGIVLKEKILEWFL